MKVFIFRKKSILIILAILILVICFIPKNNFTLALSLSNSEVLNSSFKDKFDALRDLIKHLVDEDSALVTILYGEDVSDEDANALIDEFNNEYPDFEFDIRKGNQPVYSFIVGVE